MSCSGEVTSELNSALANILLAELSLSKVTFLLHQDLHA